MWKLTMIECEVAPRSSTSFKRKVELNGVLVEPLFISSQVIVEALSCNQ